MSGYDFDGDPLYQRIMFNLTWSSVALKTAKLCFGVMVASAAFGFLFGPAFAFGGMAAASVIGLVQLAAWWALKAEAEDPCNPRVAAKTAKLRAWGLGGKQ